MVRGIQGTFWHDLCGFYDTAENCKRFCVLVSGCDWDKWRQFINKSDHERNFIFRSGMYTQHLGRYAIERIFIIRSKGDDLWECWGISAHPNGDVTLRDCGFRGMKLSELWKKHPEVFGKVDSDRFPLLIKIIDAKDDLSIQVHPDDDYAKVHENGSLGKTECWYILDCKKNATIVIGHNSRTKEELSRMIHEGKWSEFIREIPIKKGDFLQIDPGTVHAIKGGTLILETQQNSDITYRVYDYGRLSNGKPRELHIDKSIDVITVPAKSVADSVKSVADLPVNTLNELYVCKYFHIYKIEVSGKMTFEQNAPFMNMTVTEGNGIVNGQPVKKGDHFILPNGFGNVELQGRMQIIASTI